MNGIKVGTHVVNFTFVLEETKTLLTSTQFGVELAHTS